MKTPPNSAGANAGYAWQFTLRAFGWRESLAAWLSFWSFGGIEHHKIMKAKIIRSVIFGLLALLAGAVALGVFQVCFVESFFLHAMVAPINPQTIFQPTAFTYIGVVCQMMIPACFLLGAAFLLRAAWLFFKSRKNVAA